MSLSEESQGCLMLCIFKIALQRHYTSKLSVINPKVVRPTFITQKSVMLPAAPRRMESAVGGGRKVFRRGTKGGVSLVLEARIEV
jgi:hypothetical protein